MCRCDRWIYHLICMLNELWGSIITASSLRICSLWTQRFGWIDAAFSDEKASRRQQHPKTSPKCGSAFIADDMVYVSLMSTIYMRMGSQNYQRNRMCFCVWTCFDSMGNLADHPRRCKVFVSLCRHSNGVLLSRPTFEKWSTIWNRKLQPCIWQSDMQRQTGWTPFQCTPLLMHFDATRKIPVTWQMRSIDKHFVIWSVFLVTVVLEKIHLIGLKLGKHIF